MNIPLDFALNHMVAPHLSLRAFFALAQRLGVKTVEIRNDLAGTAISDGTPAETVRREAEAAGVTILSINALQRFNHWSEARAAEAQQLIDYARACGAKALVLCPVNDERFAPPETERLSMLRDALAELRPRLAEAGLVGLVEPLGFAECSLRLKAEAVAVIEALGASGTFALVHDTFHHHVSGETETFPEATGLIHTSGVIDPALGAAQMRDPHRVLVTSEDRIDNCGQIADLRRRGYSGPVSFEPFASSVHDDPAIEGALRTSMALIEHALRKAAA